MHPPRSHTAVKRDMVLVLKNLTFETFFAHTEGTMLTGKKTYKSQ